MLDATWTMYQHSGAKSLKSIFNTNNIGLQCLYCDNQLRCRYVHSAFKQTKHSNRLFNKKNYDANDDDDTDEHEQKASPIMYLIVLIFVYFYSAISKRTIYNQCGLITM